MPESQFVFNFYYKDAKKKLLDSYSYFRTVTGESFTGA